MSNDSKNLADMRRKTIKKYGKKMFRGTLMDFLSSQSRIPDEPVLDNALFPWAEDLRSQWTVMRDELDALLDLAVAGCAVADNCVLHRVDKAGSVHVVLSVGQAVGDDNHRYRRQHRLGRLDGRLDRFLRSG